MKILTIALSLFITTALAAQTPPSPRTRTRTVVVKDGKVITDDGDAIPFRHELFGGKRAHLGVSLVDLTPELRDHYGASKDAGVLVGAVEDGSPADKAGVRVGDIILSIDGKGVDSSMDIRTGLNEKKEGDSVRIEVLRGRNRQALVASVVEKEGVRFLRGAELGNLPMLLDSPEWRARLQTIGPSNCDDLQGRIKELEGRLKELEKKLQR
ncbi:MAG TPA: PDZ domain-containing protein [Thermoanaerobaculia bacterium]|nr:PDZ domain-containing protein [Thermoanaerobaculia bacterium]